VVGASTRNQNRLPADEVSGWIKTNLRATFLDETAGTFHVPVNSATSKNLTLHNSNYEVLYKLYEKKKLHYINYSDIAIICTVSVN